LRGFTTAFTLINAANTTDTTPNHTANPPHMQVPNNNTTNTTLHNDLNIMDAFETAFPYKIDPPTPSPTVNDTTNLGQYIQRKQPPPIQTTLNPYNHSTNKVYYSQEYTLEELESIPAIEQTTLRLMEEE
jgi:hypothetical protein